MNSKPYVEFSRLIVEFSHSISNAMFNKSSAMIAWLNSASFSKKIMRSFNLGILFPWRRILEFVSLHWRHNERHGVSNHQPNDCLLNRIFRRRSNKTSKLRVTGLCESPPQEPVTRKMFSLDDVIMILRRITLSKWRPGRWHFQAQRNLTTNSGSHQKRII